MAENINTAFRIIKRDLLLHALFLIYFIRSLIAFKKALFQLNIWPV